MLNYKHYEFKEKLLPLIELQLNTRLSRNGVETFVESDVCGRHSPGMVDFTNLSVSIWSETVKILVANEINYKILSSKWHFVILLFFILAFSLPCRPIIIPENCLLDTTQNVTPLNSVIFFINLIDCKHLFHCNKLFIGTARRSERASASFEEIKNFVTTIDSIVSGNFGDS